VRVKEKIMNMSKKLKQVCLFVHYNIGGGTHVEQYVFDYLKELEEIGFQTFVISNSAINAEYKQSLSEKIKNCTVLERENKGIDFGAWKWAIAQKLIPEDTDYLLLANDSVFGPLFPLEPIFQAMQSNQKIDFWGLTDSYERGTWHLQSYFLYLPKRVFTSAAFKKVFESNFHELDKLTIIKNGEIQLSKSLTDKGFKGAAYFPYTEVDATGLMAHNPTHYYWDILIEKFKFPFIKRDLIMQNAEHIASVGKVFYLLEKETNYKLDNIKQAIVNFLKSFNSEDVIKHKISAICHIYYPESIYFFLSKIAILNSSKTKYIFNLSSSLYYDSHFCDILTTAFPESIILYTPSQGRDIGGKLAAIDSLLRCDIETDYSILIHDKVSPHTPTGLEWRNNLLKIIDKDNLHQVFKKFQHEEIGVITSNNFIKNEYDPDKNKFTCTSSDNIFYYIKKFSLNISNYTFAAGTIFWIKTKILKDFFSVNTPMSVRKELEKGNALDFVNGTNIHAWERLFSFIAHSQGFKTTGI
jgi:lipopolysaccharide biosynthesis protein